MVGTLLMAAAVAIAVGAQRSPHSKVVASRCRARLPHHASDLSERHSTIAPMSADAAEIERLRRAQGAPDRCYVLSEDEDVSFVSLAEGADGIVPRDGAGLAPCLLRRMALDSDEAPRRQLIMARSGDGRSPEDAM
jgi:hypothetical protein